MISGMAVKKLAKVLQMIAPGSKQPVLQSLNLSNNLIDNDSAKTLYQTIQKLNINLQILHLENNTEIFTNTIKNINVELEKNHLICKHILPNMKNLESEPAVYSQAISLYDASNLKLERLIVNNSDFIFKFMQFN
jgi:hypothetical protein